MLKIELSFDQRIENFFISFYITAGNIQSVKEMVSTRRDIRDFIFFWSAPIGTRWFCICVFYMQHDSVQPGCLLFVVISI